MLGSEQGGRLRWHSLWQGLPEEVTLSWDLSGKEEPAIQKSRAS